MADILVVDDEQIIIDLVAALLRQAGHAVRAATDGLAGVESALAEPPDLVVLDMSMPRMDGYQVARKLRELAATRDVPILALTAHAGASEYDDAYKAGCSAFLAKPISAGPLLERVSALLRERP